METNRKYFETQTEAEDWLINHSYTAPETPTSYWCDGYQYADVRYNSRGFFIVRHTWN